MRIIVTLTSWIKRISDVPLTIESILNGSIKPNKIILNLSIEEFNGIQLPAEILRLEQTSCLEINWIEGRNTKTFKKLLPTIDKYPDDIIISVDDDILYPVNFIETLLDTYFEDPTRPVTVSYFAIDGVLFPWGGGTLYRSEFLKGYNDLLDDEVIDTNEDDWFYAYVMLRNQVKLRLVKSDMCYSPQLYVQHTDSDQLYLSNGYNRNHTKNVLDHKLEAHGDTFIQLADKLFIKYKNDF